MSVTVTTIPELISALSGSDAIVWSGASRVESVTLEVAQQHTSTGYINALNVPSIDFNGLTIGTLSTTCTAGRDFKTSGTEAQQLEAWCTGFSAIAFGGTIKNLTVEHINLDNPRDLLLKGYARLKNVYCYDIFSLSAPSDSEGSLQDR